MANSITAYNTRCILFKNSILTHPLKNRFMRYLFIIAIICILPATLYANNFEDAYALRKALSANNRTDIARFAGGKDFIPAARILMRYTSFNTETEKVYTQQIIDSFKDNPYIAPLLPVGSDNVLITDEPQFPIVGGSITPSFNITNLADGMARFLIKRGKQELNAAFFSQMKKTLNKHPECGTLFPTTTNVLNTVETYRYAELLQTLQNAFNTDLNNLLPNLNNTLNLPQYEAILKELPEIRTAIRYANILSLATNQRLTHTYNIIIRTSIAGETAITDPNLHQAFRVLNLIATSIHLYSDEWISMQQLTEMLQDDIRFRLFLGLVYERAKDISFTCNGKTTSMCEYMKLYADNAQALAAMFENFVWLANNTQVLQKELIAYQSHGSDISANDVGALIKSVSKNKDDNTQTIAAYLNNVAAMMSYGMDIATKVLPCLKGYPYFTIAENSMQLYVNTYTRNYSPAILNIYNITEAAIGKQQTLAVIKAANLRTAGKPVSEALQKLCVTKPESNSTKALTAILKYGNFIATAAKAQTPEEVENAIEAAALPAGSYSIKQKAAYNIAVNAYVGYNWDFNSSGLYMRGVYAPIGIGFNTAISKKIGGAVGIYVTLVDIGGIVAYRLENSTTNNLQQQIRLESILSPGAQLAIGIPKLPISILAGWRMTPKLFYKNNTITTIVQPMSVFNAGITVDIPLLNIANKALR